VTSPVDGVELDGELTVPTDATGLVVFAHGSGSSRHIPRNAFVAETLREHGLGTLLVDLLTEAEDREYRIRFDVGRLSTSVDLDRPCLLDFQFRQGDRQHAVVHHGRDVVRVDIVGESDGPLCGLVAAFAPDVVLSVSSTDSSRSASMRSV
jgi:hypothetical protein